MIALSRLRTTAPSDIHNYPQFFPNVAGTEDAWCAGMLSRWHTIAVSCSGLLTLLAVFGCGGNTARDGVSLGGASSWSTETGATTGVAGAGGTSTSFGGTGAQGGSAGAQGGGAGAQSSGGTPPAGAGGGLNTCALPLITGACAAVTRVFGYNTALGACVPFTYSECQGNANRFNTLVDCEKACGGLVSHCPIQPPEPNTPCTVPTAMCAYDIVSKCLCADRNMYACTPIDPQCGRTTAAAPVCSGGTCLSTDRPAIVPETVARLCICGESGIWTCKP